MVDRVGSDQLRVSKAQVQAINNLTKAIKDFTHYVRDTNAIMTEFSRIANEDNKEPTNG